MNYEGEFYALNNRCPHRGGQLGDGELKGSDLICPLHGWDFDVRTGISRYNTLDRIATYPVTVEDGKVYLKRSDIPIDRKNSTTTLRNTADPETTANTKCTTCTTSPKVRASCWKPCAPTRRFRCSTPALPARPGRATATTGWMREVDLKCVIGRTRRSRRTAYSGLY